MAYASDETGQFEVYVRPFVPPGTGSRPQVASGQWLVSTGGGMVPRWGPDGKELFFLGPAGEMMAAPISVRGAALLPGTPVRLFQTRIVGGGLQLRQPRQYDVTLDGRFLINTELDGGMTPAITLIQNWNPDAGR